MAVPDFHIFCQKGYPPRREGPGTGERGADSGGNCMGVGESDAAPWARELGKGKRKSARVRQSVTCLVCTTTAIFGSRGVVPLGNGDGYDIE